MLPNLKIYRDESWDFKGVNTKEHIHGIHSYPAMMIPQVARRILNEYGQNAKILYDPFCGTGTSLVEANLKGINAVGTDINPLALLIAKVKTTPLPMETLNEYISEFSNFMFEVKLGAFTKEIYIPQIQNIEYWFKPETIYFLSVIRYFIENRIMHKDVKDFFKVAFSSTVREVSLTRKGEFKLYRMSKKQIEKHSPDVLSVMYNTLINNKKRMEKYISLKKNTASSIVLRIDVTSDLPNHHIQQNSIDIVVTSPPYGDSKTTVAYGQFSRLSNQWLGFEEKNNVDKKSLGGIKRDVQNFNIPILDEVISKINEIDPRRAKDVYSFYYDYYKAIENISKVVKRNGTVAFVVGNRRVKGVTIPNDIITRELFVRNGFEHVITIVRRIPSKRMPLKNSPTNTTGITDVTMNKEYIVVLRKL